MVLRLQRNTPMVSPQRPRPDTRGGTMRNTARQTRDNRTITVDFRSEATYFQLLGDGKAFLECVLAFVMALGFQLKHKAACRGGGCLTRHSHYMRVRLGGVTIWRIQCTTCKAVVYGPPPLRLALSSDATGSGAGCPVGDPWRPELGAVCGALSPLADGPLSSRLCVRPPPSGHGAHPV